MSAPDDPPRFSGSWLMIAVPLAVIALLVWMALPNFILSSYHSDFNSIINNLRWLDGAKQQWASEHGISDGSRVPTRQEIIPYLGLKTFISSVVNESYVIAALSNSPEAHLTKKLKSPALPEGTIIRFGTNGAIECIRPR